LELQATAYGKSEVDRGRCSKHVDIDHDNGTTMTTAHLYHYPIETAKLTHLSYQLEPRGSIAVVEIAMRQAVVEKSD
jgi:hypothetical protein